MIAPGKTTTSRPILANDPHRAHGAPSLRYLSHLSAPGFDVIGAGEPFLPGISIGHNGTIAFGLTRFYIDHEDLYVYELNPNNPEEYRYQGRFEPFVPCGRRSRSRASPREPSPSSSPVTVPFCTRSARGTAPTLYVPPGRWGNLHQARFEHPLRALLDGERARTLDVGPFAIGGSAYTPMAAGYRSGDFGLTVGASFRMIVDVGRWDNSLAINTPGQSGDPESPHYRDLAPLWARGDYFPLLYSRPAIEKVTTARLLLRPGTKARAVSGR